MKTDKAIEFRYYDIEEPLLNTTTAALGVEAWVWLIVIVGVISLIVVAVMLRKSFRFRYRRLLHALEKSPDTLADSVVQLRALLKSKRLTGLPELKEVEFLANKVLFSGNRLTTSEVASLSAALRRMEQHL